jgi:hypothetical protein
MQSIVLTRQGSQVRILYCPPLASGDSCRNFPKQDQGGEWFSFFIPHRPWPLFPQGKRGTYSRVSCADH